MSAIDERVLALAGLVQALKQVRTVAETGQSEASTVTVAIDSVFRIDADSTLDIYGGVQALQPGLRLLRNYLGNKIEDPALPLLTRNVMQLERRFARSGTMVQEVQSGLLALTASAQQDGSTHPEVLDGLGRLYASTISRLRPRVMVQGNPHYLGQPGVVAEIRALLLAGMRSAVLWRQLGGSPWDFLLRRKQMLAAVDARLGQDHA